MKSALDQALEYLECVPKATAQVKSNDVKEAWRDNGMPGDMRDYADRWAAEHGLTVTHDGKTPVLADTYFFRRKECVEPEKKEMK